MTAALSKPLAFSQGRPFQLLLHIARCEIDSQTNFVIFMCKLGLNVFPNAVDAYQHLNFVMHFLRKIRDKKGCPFSKTACRA